MTTIEAARNSTATEIAAVAAVGQLPQELRVDVSAARFEPQVGDLVFGNRLSWMQMVMNVSGDYLSHVAVIDFAAGQWIVIEMGPHGVGTRTLDDFVAAYRHTAFARPAMHDLCRATVVEAARQRLASQDLVYTFSACVILQSSMLLRRFLPARAERIVNQAGRWLAGELERCSPNSVTCSGFVYQCLRHACDRCALAAAWPTRQPTPVLRSAPSVRDVRPNGVTSETVGTQTLVTPYDIWVSQPAEFRSINEGGRITMLVDLTRRSLSAAEPVAC